MRPGHLFLFFLGFKKMLLYIFYYHLSPPTPVPFSISTHQGQSLLCTLCGHWLIEA